jgi:signal transduction histidine kinase
LINCAKDIPGLPSEVYEKYLKPANHCSEYLKFLINDLLDYTEINFSKDLRLVFEEVNIQNLLKEIDDLLHMKATMRKVALLFEIDPDTPETIWTDPRRLKQILINLVGNSLKFTFKGHVKVCLSQVKQDDEDTE